MKPFRLHHLLSILKLYDTIELPLDLILRHYFKTHHAIGSKDRREIAETVYTLIRWRALIDHLPPHNSSWEGRIEKALHLNPSQYAQDLTLPTHIRLSFPKSFFDFLTQTLGLEQAVEFCRVSNETAPITVRVNLLKTTREAFMKAISDRYRVTACAHAPAGVVFQERENFFAMPEFKAGLFEIQDEGSQLIGDLIEPKEKHLVLDFCSGSGGKTLCFAPKMQGRGQIFLHDIRPAVLKEARKRLKRAGIENAQILLPHASHDHLKGKMDWVLVDAPCTGTGTLRRNPDMKWKWTEKSVHNLVAEQRRIFAQALSFLKPNGRIVYATCSVLPQENEEQIAFFQSHHPIVLNRLPLSLPPQSRGMDGFFGAVLTPINKNK